MKYKNYCIQYIPILENNFVWIIHNYHTCIVIDPGSGEKIIKKIEEKKLIPTFIYLTHHHYDHINGIKKFLQRYPNIKIVTSKILFKKKKYLKNQILLKKKNIFFFNKNYIKTFFTPGHTKYDVSYYLKPFFFSGDLIFTGGCGNTKDGSFKKLYNSLKLISKLPKNTIFLCSHEYSLKNFEFLSYFFKKNFYINEYFYYLKKINFKNFIITNSLKIEKKINIFLKILNLKKNLINKPNFLNIQIKECLEYYWNDLKENKCNNFQYFKFFRKMKDVF
ncbi:MBL fold metallo-hydrolase [Buchnera aphidicola]|uniref:MBL fold metallo-hydrolase n=1 Tax=Buchnera aphidicola TaxID=9 RepID=UPI0030EF4468